MNFMNLVLECDDGNIIGADGCSALCEVEQLWACIPSFPTPTIMGPSICTFTCVDSTNEVFQTLPFLRKAKECDDGDSNNDNGCTSNCVQNTGWICANGTNTTPDDCLEVCGDGYDYFTYACDDGNLVGGDGCSDTCTIEPGFTCQYGDYPFPDICTFPCSPTSRDYGVLPCVDSNSAPLDGY